MQHWSSQGALVNWDLLDPATLAGAVFYAAVFFVSASVAARLIRTSVKRLLTHADHAGLDRTGIQFLTQLSQALVYLCALVLWAHAVPVLRQLGTALLAGVSVASVVIGLAAQNTLGNVIAGFALLLYRPFKIGDRVQVVGPAGLATGTVESLNLGYTMIRGDDGRRLIAPNSTMATQVTVNLNDAKLDAKVG
jgi:small conductance mechanosensitive channel